MTERQKRLAWAAVFVASATAISRLVGIAREMLTANYFGLSPELNAYTSVAVIPNLVRQLFADAAISAAFVPVFTALLTKGERERAYKLASAMLSFMLFVVSALVLALVVAAPLVVRLFYPELVHDPTINSLAVDVMRILLPTVVVLSTAGVIIGILYSFERFTGPAVISIVWNLVIIAFLVFFADGLGVYALALGTLVGTVAELLILLVPLRRLGFHWHPTLAFGDPDLRRVLLLMVPVTVTLGVLNFNAIINYVFAQYISDTAAAQINYAFRLFQLPQGVFAITIGTVLFPSLSRFAALEETDRFRETLSLGIRQIFFISLPFVAWFMVTPEAVVRPIYQYGRFDAAATEKVAGALAFFALGLAFANANIMFNRGFQSLQRPWLPMEVSLINLGLNAGLDALLYRPLGVRGITLATALVSTFNFVALLYLMRRQIDFVDGRRILRSVARIIVCTAALAVTTGVLWWALQPFADGGTAELLVAVVVAFGAGAVIYVGAAKALRVEELATVAGLVRRRRGVAAEGPSAVD